MGCTHFFCGRRAETQPLPSLYIKKFLLTVIHYALKIHDQISVRAFLLEAALYKITETS
jgi:hypothetical protein